MSQYLKEMPQDEAMAVVYEVKPAPPILPHSIWTGDFMGMCKHDIPCQVCFDAPALIERDVTPGRASQTIQPCQKCQSIGWRLSRRRWWQRLGL